MRDGEENSIRPRKQRAAARGRHQASAGGPKARRRGTWWPFTQEITYTPPRAVHSGRDLREMGDGHGWWETQRVGVKSDHRNVEADLESFSFRMPGVRPHTAHKGGVCEDRPSGQKRVEVGLEWRGDLNLSAHFSCR